MVHPTDPEVRLKALTIVWFARLTILLVCVGFVIGLLGSLSSQGADLKGTFTAWAVLWIPTGLFLGWLARRQKSESDGQSGWSVWSMLMIILWPGVGCADMMLS